MSKFFCLGYNDQQAICLIVGLTTLENFALYFFDLLLKSNRLSFK